MSFIDRRRWLKMTALTGMAALAGRLPDALAAPNKTYRIFMVLGRGDGPNEAGFKDFLSRRGMKVEYIVRNTGGDVTKLPAIIDEIRSVRPDLVYAWGTPQTRGLVGAYDDPQPSRYIRDIPVLFTYVAAPVDARIVRSLEQPGGNVTGTVHIAPVAAQVSAIVAYRAINKLGVVFNPAERNSVLAVDDLRSEWQKRGHKLIEAPVPLINGKPDPGQISRLIEHCKSKGAEMMYLGPDTFMAGINRKLVAETLLALKLPSFSATEPIVRVDGAMFSLSSSGYGIGRFTGLKASQILLEGRNPGEIPVETLRRFSIVINIATAKALSYYPPIGLLNYAEVVGT